MGPLIARLSPQGSNPHNLSIHRSVSSRCNLAFSTKSMSTFLDWKQRITRCCDKETVYEWCISKQSVGLLVVTQPNNSKSPGFLLNEWMKARGHCLLPCEVHFFEQLVVVEEGWFWPIKIDKLLFLKALSNDAFDNWSKHRTGQLTSLDLVWKHVVTKDSFPSLGLSGALMRSMVSFVIRFADDF